jgi:NhaP-type Na+/H+ or K+/H+ antiporter
MGSLLAAIIFLPGSFTFVVENALISFISSAILGIIGGVIGILATGKTEEKNIKADK